MSEEAVSLEKLKQTIQKTFDSLQIVKVEDNPEYEQLHKDILKWKRKSKIEVAACVEKLQKQQEEKATRLLMLRVGGRYRDFEAGMLYQLLLELGLKEEYKTHKEVDDLIAVTCHCLRESDARLKLKEVLREGNKP